MVPKGLVGGGQGRQIEGGEFVLEFGCCLSVQKGFHVFVAEQNVYHSVGSFAADGLVGTGSVEVERLKEVGRVLDGLLERLCGFLLTGNGDEIVAEFHLVVIGTLALEGGTAFGADRVCCCPASQRSAVKDVATGCHRRRSRTNRLCCYWTDGTTGFGSQKGQGGYSVRRRNSRRCHCCCWFWIRPWRSQHGSHKGIPRSSLHRIAHPGFKGMHILF